MKPLIRAALLTAALTIPTAMNAESQRVNPFMEPYGTKYEIPAFDRIQYSDYLPAINKGLEIKRGEIKAIAENPAEPTFENTIFAMEKSGKLLSEVMRVFGSLCETDNTPEMQELSETIYPLVSAASDEVKMNPRLFERVKKLYDKRDKLGLKPYEVRAIELSYKDFVRNGALLSQADKNALMEVNKALTDLFLKYNKNLLAATNSFELVVDSKADLAGIPAGIVATGPPRPRSAARMASGCSLSMPPAVCPCSSMPIRVPCARRCTRDISTLPLRLLMTTVPSSARLSSSAPARPPYLATRILPLT